MHWHAACSDGRKQYRSSRSRPSVSVAQPSANKLPEMRCWVYDVHGGCAPPAQGGSNERAHTRSHPHTGCPRAHCSLILSADRADEGAAGSACRVAAGREDGPCSPVNLTWPAPAHSAAASDKTAEPVCVPTGCLLWLSPELSYRYFISIPDCIDSTSN